MKVLILGGTGAIGVHLVDLLKLNHEVHVTSRRQRKSSPSVNYIQGNAKNKKFIEELLGERWDVIIDFMVYNTEEFKSRVHLFLENSEQYIFISSARVFSNSDLINEDTCRLIDLKELNEEYRKTDEYGLAKARQEDILHLSGKTNWTIVRPYITYNRDRLQLGVLEKEEWLYRALQGKNIVFSEDLMNKRTTITFGEDVSDAISKLVANEKSFGQSFNITTKSSILWSDILELYLKEIKDQTGALAKVILLEKEEFLLSKPISKYQFYYDRMFDRQFDNEKIEQVSGKTTWMNPVDGLKSCLKSFLEKPSFRHIDWEMEIIRDKMSKEIALPWQIPGLKNKLRYYYKRFK